MGKGEQWAPCWSLPCQLLAVSYVKEKNITHKERKFLLKPSAGQSYTEGSPFPPRDQSLTRPTQGPVQSSVCLAMAESWCQADEAREFWGQTEALRLPLNTSLFPRCSWLRHIPVPMCLLCVGSGVCPGSPPKDLCGSFLDGNIHHPPNWWWAAVQISDELFEEYVTLNGL